MARSVQTPRARQARNLIRKPHNPSRHREHRRFRHRKAHRNAQSVWAPTAGCIFFLHRVWDCLAHEGFESGPRGCGRRGRRRPQGGPLPHLSPRPVRPSRTHSMSGGRPGGESGRRPPATEPWSGHSARRPGSRSSGDVRMRWRTLGARRQGGAQGDGGGWIGRRLWAVFASSMVTPYFSRIWAVCRSSWVRARW